MTMFGYKDKVYTTGVFGCVVIDLGQNTFRSFTLLSGWGHEKPYNQLTTPKYISYNKG